MGLLERLFGRERRHCRTCGCAFVAATASTLTGRVRSLVVELPHVPVLRCPAGHEAVVQRHSLCNDLVLAAVVDEQIPAAIIRPLGAPLCLRCGGKLDTAHVSPETRVYDVTLTDGLCQQVRVTGPHVRCVHCDAWQLFSNNPGDVLMRALRDALRLDRSVGAGSTRQTN